MDNTETSSVMEWNVDNIWYCLKALRTNPCATWGDTYESIIWSVEENDGQTLPTKEEMETVWSNGIAKQTQGLKLLRIERNFLLKECDYVMTIDYFNSLTPEKQTEWSIYRQNLRDLPSTQTPSINDNGELINVTYPTKPT